MSQKNKSHENIIDALKAMLLSETIATQDEFKYALENQGFNVNQSKISRLLRKLGAIKITNERKQIVYSLPLEPTPVASRGILSQLIMNIDANETLIVIHTNPGSASLIGRLIDHNSEELNIIGTVAGDDTIFIAPASVKSIAKTLQLLKRFFKEIG